MTAQQMVQQQIGALVIENASLREQLAGAQAQIAELTETIKKVEPIKKAA